MEAFLANPKVVWEWYNWRRELMAGVAPNDGHRALAECERVFDQFTLITQNVDGLHAAAGSNNVIELHGNIHRNKCADCNRPMDITLQIEPSRIPTCGHCGGKIRPDVVWFGEMLDDAVTDAAFTAADEAQVFLVVGTSALVHPAASIPLVAKRQGAILVEINPEETPLTPLADYHIAEKSGVFLPSLLSRIAEIRAARGVRPL